MKKFTLFTFLFLISMTFAFAQTITNPSFETWAPYGGGAGDFPTGWTTSDSASMVLGPATHSAVQEIVDKCHLNASVKLTTWSASGFLTVPAAATNGVIKVVGASFTVSGGNPSTQRNDSLTGCYKYVPQGTGNVATISAVLFKRNGPNRDTIGAAIWTPTPAASMTNFSIPFVYKAGLVFPDSILVVLTSSALSATAGNIGSTLTVDNLALKGILSSVPENKSFTSVKVYPSPVTGDVLNIDVNVGQYKNSTYTLIDGLGRIAKTGTLKEKQSLDVTQLANGMYTLTLNASSGEQLYSTRVSLNR